MILADTNEPVALGISDRIGITKFARRGKGLRLFPRFQPVKSLVGEVGEINDPFMDHKGTPSIFMNLGPGIIGGRVNIDLLPLRTLPDNNRASGFRRPHFKPVDSLIVKGYLTKPNRF
jgi:hypothetical protein